MMLYLRALLCFSFCTVVRGEYLTWTRELIQCLCCWWFSFAYTYYWLAPHLLCSLFGFWFLFHFFSWLLPYSWLLWISSHSWQHDSHHSLSADWLPDF
jgi:hypothetical protein